MSRGNGSTVLTGPEEEVLHAERDRYIHSVLPAAFQALSPRDLTLLKLHHVDGARQKDIADLHGVHPSRVSRKLDRIYRTVRKRATELLVKQHGLKTKEAREFMTRVTQHWSGEIDDLIGGEL